MFPAPSRRDFLQILLGGAAGLSLPAAVFAQRPERIDQRHARTPIESIRLNDNLMELSGAGGNVVVVSGSDGLLMVNGGLRERSAELLRLVAEQTGGKRVQALFNTDWHAEHTGSNEMIGKGGAKIITHENTKQYLGAEIFVDWQNRTYKPVPPYALPNQTFYTSGKMTFGGVRIEYGHLGQAHTDGDIYVFLPESNVLVVGDVLSVGTYPICDYTTGGWLGGLLNATKTLIELTNAETRIVPGVGPLQTRRDLQAQHDMLATLRDRLAKMMRQGMSARDMLAAGATKEFDATLGNPELFLTTTYKGMWLHVRELGGIV